MPDSVIIQVVSDRFVAWAASLPESDQAELAGWLGLDDTETSEDRRAEREQLGRQLIAKLRRFAGSELSPEELSMLRVVLLPGLQMLLPGTPHGFESPTDEIIPRGMSGVISTALIEQLDRDAGDQGKSS